MTHDRYQNMYRAAAGFAAMAAFAGAAGAQTFENESGGSVTFYGQFSPTFLSYDDGAETTSTVADNANSNTRVGFVLMQPFGKDTLEFHFETSLGLVQTSAISNGVIPNWIDWQKTDLRKVEALYAASFGTITFGQGPMATDGVALLDFSGTTIASYAHVPDVAGGFAFRADDGVLSDITISDTFSDLDGPRRFRLRYETPELSGITFAAAYGKNVLSEDDDNEYYDAALRWSSATEMFQLAAAAGYAWKQPPQGDTEEQYMGSASLLHLSTGLNLTIAGGAVIDGGSYGYVKGGWIGDLTALGATAFSVGYYSGSDFVTDGSTSKSLGVAAVQNFDDIDLQVYLGWGSYQYDDTDLSYQDGQSILAGARWRF